MEEKKSINFKAYLLAFVISLIAGLIVFVVYFFAKEQSLYDAINGSSISMVLLLAIGGLAFVAREGFFDIFAYGIKQVGSSFFSKKPNENNDFVGYKDQKRITRESKPKLFISLFLSGSVFLICLIVLKIVESINH